MQPGNAAVTHRRVQIHYAVRAGSFLYCFAVLAIHGWQLGLVGWFWPLLAAQFLVYPHLAFWRARRAKRCGATGRTAKDWRCATTTTPVSGISN